MKVSFRGGQGFALCRFPMNLFLSRGAIHWATRGTAA